MRNSNNNQNLVVKARRIGAAILVAVLTATTALTMGRTTIASKPQNTATESVSYVDQVSKEELDEIKAHLRVDIDSEDVQASYPEVSREFLSSSLPSMNRIRVRDSGNISTALTLPFTGASQEDGQTYSTEVIYGWWNVELVNEILRNPPVGVAVAKCVNDTKLSDGTTIGDENTWIMNKFIAKDNSHYAEGGHGVSDWLTREYENGPALVTDEYRYYGVALCNLLGRFTDLECKRVYSEKHWGLKARDDNHASLVRAEAFEEPENRDAIIAYLTTKSGAKAAAIAFNVHDKRPMIPGKQPKPEQETTPQETTQETTPQETTKETTPQETTAPETKTPVVNRETTPRETTPRETTPRETTPRETTPRETTPKETTPQETQPSETPSREDREDNNKKRNVAPVNHGGEGAGGSSKRTGTNTVEYNDHKNETGKGHGDPAKETMVAPTTEAPYQDVEVKQNHENRMNQETKTAESAANRLTDDKSGKQLQINGDANQAAKDGASVISNYVGDFEDHD